MTTENLVFHLELIKRLGGRRNFVPMDTKKNNKNVWNNNKKKKNKIKEEDILEKLNAAPISKSLMRSSPVPRFMLRKMNFYEPSLVLQGATTFLVREWRINSLFDPDPLIGGGSVSGYTQLAALYLAHRVENFAVKYEVAGNEPGTPVVFGLIFRDTQPSLSILTHANAQNSLEQAPTDGPHIVGQTTGMDVYRSPLHKIKPSAIVGNPLMYEADTTFQSAVNTNPVQLVWMAFIVLSGTGAVLTNGCILNIYMEFTARWFSPANFI